MFFYSVQSWRWLLFHNDIHTHTQENQINYKKIYDYLCNKISRQSGKLDVLYKQPNETKPNRCFQWWSVLIIYNRIWQAKKKRKNFMTIIIIVYKWYFLLKTNFFSHLFVVKNSNLIIIKWPRKKWFWYFFFFYSLTHL